MLNQEHSFDAERCTNGRGDKLWLGIFRVAGEDGEHIAKDALGIRAKFDCSRSARLYAGMCLVSHLNRKLAGVGEFAPEAEFEEPQEPEWSPEDDL